MRIRPMPELTQRTKFRSLLQITPKQSTNSLSKNDVVYQRNAVLVFKKPTKIGKKQLLQMLTKKNSVLEGTFALQNNKILLITETKQTQKQSHPPSFRKKCMKTNFKRMWNQNLPQPSIKQEIAQIQQKRQRINKDILRKYFAKNHLFNSDSGTSRNANHLQGLKLLMNGSVLNWTEPKDDQSCRQQRVDKRNRSIQYVNNFMRTRYKTIQNGDKEIQTQRQKQIAQSMIHVGRHSELKNKSLFQPWEKKEEYDQFQL